MGAKVALLVNPSRARTEWFDQLQLRLKAAAGPSEDSTPQNDSKALKLILIFQNVPNQQ
jgi:hypothetical protein